MTLPKIATDDLLLFGSFALTALGVALVVAATTSDLLLAAGAALIAFSVPSALVTFMAAAEEPS